MSHTPEREYHVLQALVRRPGLIDAAELTISMFSREKHRSLFRAVTEQWENERAETLDLIRLSEKSGLTVAEVSAFLDGSIVLEPQQFVRQVNVLRQRRAAEQAYKISLAEGEACLKTGEVSIEKIAELRKCWEEIEALEGQGSKNGAILRPLSEVQPQAVEWVWPNRIPRGKLSLIVGDPGLGKSFLSLDVAARISTGAPWPDSSDRPAPGSVLILTAEDGLADTVRPRADAAGADVSKLIVLDGVLEKGEKRPFSLQDHLPVLENAIRATPDLALVIIDPLSAFLGELDSHKNAEVRGALAPISSLAEKYNIAIIGISHLNKSESVKAIYRVTGSLSFVAAARACWAVTKDQDDEEDERRLFIPLKTNLSIRPSGLAFRIQGGRLAFEAQPLRVDADEALAAKTEDREERSFADDWLHEALQAGPVAVNEVLKGAKDAGISRRTAYNAAKRIRALKRGTGFGKFKTSTWELPT